MTLSSETGSAETESSLIYFEMDAADNEAAAQDSREFFDLF